MSYHLSIHLDQAFDTALNQVREALLTAGFGIVSDIDLQTTFKNKLQRPFRAYRILGACKPEYAWQALAVEPFLGTLLPCNIVVQESLQGGVDISAIDPMVSLQSVGEGALADMAAKVQFELQNVLNQLKSSQQSS